MADRSVAAACRKVLDTADPFAKVMAARAVAREWRLGKLAHVFDVPMPDRPARPDRPELLPPNRMPKRGKGGSERGRTALIHALAHIEFVAIDLAFDMVGRFGALFPPAFVDAFMRVGADEAIHFALLDRRLKQMGSFYGALPAHNGLWEAAIATSGDVLARLAVVPMAMEARGLDVTPAAIERFAAVQDKASARILTRILNDEIRHVQAGTFWFESACRTRELTPETTWKTLISRQYNGLIKPPFNDSARQAAGLSRDYYSALAAEHEDGSKA